MILKGNSVGHPNDPHFSRLVATNLGQMAMLVTTNQAKWVATNITKLVCTHLSNLYVSSH